MSAFTKHLHKGRAVVVYTPDTRCLFAKEWLVIRRSIARHAHVVAELEVEAPDTVARALHAYRPDLLIAAGGDGTVNLCVRAMTGDVLLAVMPLGTANDLHRSLGKPSYRTRCIDRIGVNDQAFCTTGGLGIPSTISQQVNRWRQGGFGRHTRKMGRRIYPVVAAKVVLRRETPVQWMEVEWVDAGSGRTEGMRLHTHTLFVTNQATFAGSLMVVRDSVNDDGHFEIFMLTNPGFWRDLMVTARIAMAANQRSRDCVVLRAVSARVTTTEPMPFFGDGEILETSRRFELKIAAGALQVLNPDWNLERMARDRKTPLPPGGVAGPLHH